MSRRRRGLIHLATREKRHELLVPMARPWTPRYFPSPEEANPFGLVAIGGALSREYLLDAYQHGIFPWPTADGILAWWSPDPRAVIEPSHLIVTERLKRTCRSERFEVTCDRDFAGVIQGCATAQGRLGNTWITDELQAAYVDLHQAGIAHSIEAWSEGTLAGGVYGLAFGGMFSAESMFYRVRDASKVAIVHLIRHLDARGFQLVDIQQITPHMARFGAVEIPRAEFLRRLREALELAVQFGGRLESASRA